MYVMKGMFHILIFCPVLLADSAQTLTIDTQLGTSVEDCFERMALGQQLPSGAIYRNISELTLDECEHVCKQDRQCQSYDYGVGAKGNATCNLSSLGEKELNAADIILKHPDYDVYVRRFQCEQPPPKPIQVQFDDPDSQHGHRPIYRPYLPEESRKPVKNNYDLKPYETNNKPRPVHDTYHYGTNQRPHYDQGDDRPDFYYENRPDDRPIGYGPHVPQEVPYKPDTIQKPYGVLSKPNYNRPDYYYETRPDERPGYGLHVPQEIPYKPNTNQKPYGVHNNDRPDYYLGPKPDDRPGYGPHVPQEPLKPERPIRKPIKYDPYDILYFHNHHIHMKPHIHDLENWNQNAYSEGYLNIPRPTTPTYYPEKPITKPVYENVYPIKNPIRPVYNQRPHGYGIPDAADSFYQTYYRPENGYLSPIKPPEYYTPHPTVNNQYSGTHHQNTYNTQNNNGYKQNNIDKNIYVQITDPPYKYQKPDNPKAMKGNHSISAYNPYGSVNQNKPFHDNSYIDYYENNNSNYGHNNKPYEGKPDYESYEYTDNSHKKPTNNYYGHDTNNYGHSHNKPTHGYYEHNSNTYPQNQKRPSGGYLEYDNHNYYGHNQNKPSHGYYPHDNSNVYDKNKQSQGTYGHDKNNYGHNQNKPTGGYLEYDDKNNNYGHNRRYYEHENNYGQTQNRPTQGSYDNNYGGHNRKPQTTPGYETSNAGYGSQTSGKPSTKPSTQKPSSNNSYNQPNAPDIRPVYEYELESSKGTKVSSKPVSISDYGNGTPGQGFNLENAYKACYRRVLAGQRALRSHVRKVLACERLEDCRRECAIERRFHCESFNYRLDPSFRGKGLCELMTKPIEAFDLRRDFVQDKDYDFYELDRNSLEPNCPTTLRGPSYLHSGFFSSSSGNRRPADRNDYWDRRKYNNNRRPYNDRDNGRDFIPYQIGIGRSDDDEQWGQYGGHYGANYYANRNEHRTSYDHWGLKNERPDFYGVRPYSNDNDFDYGSLGNRNYHGRKSYHDYGYGSQRRPYWNNSDYDNNSLLLAESKYYGPSHKKHYEEDSDNFVHTSKDCSSRRRPGMSLSSGAVRRSLLARTVLNCEAACFNEREFKCVSYSYRYSNSRGGDNCFLSERPFVSLDMSSDSGSDVYAMPQEEHCSVNHRPWIESECFWHVRAGVAIGGRAIRASLTVTGLGACEAECIRAHNFFCRGFSFRFDSPVIGDEVANCLLTSSPPTSLEPGRGLRASPGHEVYARGNYGRGCEPALYDEIGHREKQCYLIYDSAARLKSGAVRGQARVRDAIACGEACTDAPFRCLSYSFTTNAPPDEDNCLLSEIRLFDLQKGIDYDSSSQDNLYAFDLFNGQCWRKKPGKDYDSNSEVPRPIAPISNKPPQTIHTLVKEPGYLPSGPPSHPGNPGSGPSYLPGDSSYPAYDSSESSYPEYSESGGASGPGYIPDRPGPAYIPDRPISPPGPEYGPDIPIGPSGPAYRPSKPPGYLPGYPDAGLEPGYEEHHTESWRHYTVLGLPCRKGTTCAQNKVAGHWACEPEGGEIGSWDYCCTPKHRCGYSEGFHKPWCYVGPSADQWRPCSDKYYPYHHHKVPHPSQRPTGPDRPWYGHKKPPVDSYLQIEEHHRIPQDAYYPTDGNRKYWEDLYANGPKAYYDRYGNPLPGYARVPMSERPHIKYHHSYGPRPGDGSHWVPLTGLDSQEELGPPIPGGLGVPRYWPVAYLHKGPPPNMTKFEYNKSEDNRKHFTTTARTSINTNPKIPPLALPPRDFKHPDKQHDNDLVDKNLKNNHRDEKNRNITDTDGILQNNNEKTTTTTPKQVIVKEMGHSNSSEVESVDTEGKYRKEEALKDITGKLSDFSGSIEVLDIEDAKKGDKLSEVKTLEAEEEQIEAIGRLLASRRDGKIVLEKRSQNELDAKSIAIDKELAEEFNFGNKFPMNIERRGIVQRVTKEELAKKSFNDRSLEVSETTFVRPPRVLPNADNIRKVNVNGKIFYDATIREQRDLFSANSTRKQKALSFIKVTEDGPLQNFAKKKIKPRNVNPVRRARRIHRKRYNPEEVRKRLLERERMMKRNQTKIK